MTNLLETIDTLTEALNRGFTAVVFMDFAKAFDKVSHKALIAKLEAYGFGGKLLVWLRDFLNGRKQRVVMGEHSSNWLVILSGIPHWVIALYNIH